MKPLKIFRFLLVLTGSILFESAPLLACAVCFGGIGSDLSRGFYWGILLLLLLPFSILSILVGLIVYHSRKRKPQ